MSDTPDKKPEETPFKKWLRLKAEERKSYLAECRSFYRTLLCLMKVPF